MIDDVRWIEEQPCSCLNFVSDYDVLFLNYLVKVYFNFNLYCNVLGKFAKH